VSVAWYSYRLFDAADTVLYVGSTRSLTERLYKHRSRPGWGGSIARIEAVVHATRSEALDAEIADRLELNPAHSLDRDLIPKDMRLAPGELMNQVRQALSESGPLTATEVYEHIVAEGYTGPLTSVTTTMLRLRRRGDVMVVGEAPSGTPRWSSARVYAVVEVAA
jgi:hypothetical protein